RVLFRSDQGHPLALAARELRWPALLVPLQLDQPQEFHHPLADLRLAGAGGPGTNPQPEGDVLEDGHVAEERVVLEDETHPPPAGGPEGDVLAVDQHRARRVGSSSPAMMRSRVVLPEPDGPRRATSSPSGTVRHTPFRA